MDGAKTKFLSRENLKICFLLSTIAFCFALDEALPLSERIMIKPKGYFSAFLIAAFAVAFVLWILFCFNEKLLGSYAFKAPFIGGVFLLVNVYNLASAKFAALPQIHFPYPDRILAVYAESGATLLKCLLHSFRLQLLGLAIGISAGLLTGISIGWSKKAAYWAHPIIKILGPIPATAWIPIALTAFPTSFGASVFMVSLSVWFPVTVLSNSGVQNIESAYFEVARTLGASNGYQIFRIAIPGAMPSIFVGLFNGVCASFISLMSAEMLGVKFGLGWYINWQREVMSYANVYAGLIIIALFCYFFIALLFRFRDKLLIWQKGIIKW